jgi:hypothetical protein
MIHEDTLLYDELTEKWKPIVSYPEIIEVIFPTGNEALTQPG